MKNALILFAVLPHLSLLAQPEFVTFIRHAQGEHNVGMEAGQPSAVWGAIRDPHLTEKGRKQSEALRQRLAPMHFDLIVTSPLTRAIETTLIGLGDRKVPFVVMSEVAEHGGGHDCDIGSDKATLESGFPMLNFDRLEADWYSYFVKEKEENFQKRVENFKVWLRQQSAKSIAVVAHGVFLTKLMGKKIFKNTESVTVRFKDAVYLSQCAQLNEGENFLKSFNGQFVYASTDGFRLGNESKKTVFTVVRVGDNLFLKSGNLYFSANGKEGKIAGKPNAQSWEALCFKAKSEGKYFIQSRHWNTYLRANIGKNILDQTKTPGDWELFELIPAAAKE